jgi:hypothetical protein
MSDIQISQSKLESFQKNQALFSTQTPSKRIEAASRTLLWNYGQALWNPFQVFRICSNLFGSRSELARLPSIRNLPVGFSFSFFSKTVSRQEGFHLFFQGEEEDFFSLEAGPKLNWLYNFCQAQEFLFGFSDWEILSIFLRLKSIQDRGIFKYDPNRLPFALREGHSQTASSTDFLQRKIDISSV